MRTEKLESALSPQFLRRCQDIHHEIKFIGGLSEHKVTETATELDENYEVGCTDDKGPDLADAFIGFSQMLCE